MKRVWMASLATTAALFAACPEEKFCTLADCGDSFSWTFGLPEQAEGSSYLGATVEVCRNDACAEGVIANNPAGGSPTAALDEEDLTASVALDAREDASVLHVFVSLPSDATGPDVYRVTLTGSDGATLFTNQASVAAYQDFYPNGEECGPVCLQATVDETTEDSEP